MDGLQQNDEQAKQKETPNCEVRKSTRVRTTRPQSTEYAALEEILNKEDEAEKISTTSATPKVTLKRRPYKPREPKQTARRSTGGMAPRKIVEPRVPKLTARKSCGGMVPRKIVEPEGNHSSKKKTIPVCKFPSAVGGNPHAKRPKLLNADEKENQELCIGIDLGTSFSCVGVYHNGKVEIVANEHNHRITPSCLSFNNGATFVGEVAKNLMDTNPLSTIFDAKRLIGRRFSDSTLPNDQKYWPFKVVQSAEGQANVQFDLNGTCTTYTPGTVTTIILEKMKETAEAYLGEKVTNAVIAVPAHFTDFQRQAIKNAGISAGLNVLRVQNETSAAAMAYGLENKFAEVKNVLIYDLGGGFLDVSVISIKGGIFQVEGTANDSHLGGEDFDIQLVDDLAKKLKEEHVKDLSSNPHAMRRLRTACEGAKRTLSHLTEATIEILSLCEGFDFYAPVTRSYFETLCFDLFHRTLEPVKKALIDAKMDKKEINEIVLVGGSTRIPKIQELLQQFFDGKELNKSLYHGEAVACGATVQAALLSGYSLEAAKDFHLFEASSHSFGIEIVEGVMSTFIERNSRIPAKQTKIFTTKIQNQSSVLIQVYEGEGAMTRENSLVGKFILSGIYPAKRGLPRIEVTFEIDAYGMLTVTASDKSTEGRENKITQSINGGVNRVMEGKISDAGKMKLVLCENHPPLPTQILSQKSSSSSTGASRTDPILID